MDRTERQLQILDKWKKNKGIGTVIAATGFGKTYLAILSIQAIRNKYPDGQVVIVVPRKSLKKQWEDDLAQNEIENCEVYVVNTASKKKMECTHKIFDEVHRMIDGKQFSKVLKNIKSKTALALSATVDNPPYKVIDQVSKNECLRNGWVADHEVYNLAVPLNDDERRTFETVNNTYKKYEQLLGGKFHAFQKAQEYRKYIQIKRFPHGFLKNKYSGRIVKTKYLEESEEDPSKFRELTQNEIESLYAKARNAIIYYQKMNERKKILCSAINKAYAAREIKDKFQDRKAVVFSEHTEFANQVYSLMENSYLYHSKQTDKQNREALEAFKESTSGTIISARSLNEGANIPDCSLGIVAAGNSKELDNIQKEGRIIRKQGNKRALFINLFIPDTQDEKWLEKRQKGEDAIYVNSVDEILAHESYINKRLKESL